MIVSVEPIYYFKNNHTDKRKPKNTAAHGLLCFSDIFLGTHIYYLCWLTPKGERKGLHSGFAKCEPNGCVCYLV